MPVAFVFESDKIDLSRYDEVMKALGRESVAAPQPPGFIAHLAGPRPQGGWRVIDVWESEDAANAYYSSEQFRPVRDAAADAGLTTTPWPLHRTEIDQTMRQLG